MLTTVPSVFGAAGEEGGAGWSDAVVSEGAASPTPFLRRFIRRCLSASLSIRTISNSVKKSSSELLTMAFDICRIMAFRKVRRFRSKVRIHAASLLLK